MEIIYNHSIFSNFIRSSNSVGIFETDPIFPTSFLNLRPFQLWTHFPNIRSLFPTENLPGRKFKPQNLLNNQRYPEFNFFVIDRLSLRYDYFTVIFVNSVTEKNFVFFWYFFAGGGMKLKYHFLSWYSSLIN